MSKFENASIRKNNNIMEKYFFRASAKDFKKIPKFPIVYFANDNVYDLFVNNYKLEESAAIINGLFTCNNNIFVRDWFEVSKIDIDFSCKKLDETHKLWYPYNKGGEYRKYYGNSGHIVLFANNGATVREYRRSRGQSYSTPGEQYYFKKSISWSFVSSAHFGVRFYPDGFIFDIAGSSIFPKSDNCFHTILGFLISKVATYLLRLINPTLNYQVGNIRSLPLIKSIDMCAAVLELLLSLSREDWNSYETSWDFTTLPLLQANYRQVTLKTTYQSLRTHWQENTLEMQRLEEENNRIFIEAYGLEDELTPDVPLEEITLTCNPHYRYRLGKAWDDKSEEERTAELETRLQQDTAKEFISYAVGCMFGRYSLDKEGLILANQGETLDDYLAQVPNPSFMPDDDNVIPMLDGDWFTDDIVERFKDFLKVTFGEEHYDINLTFIENALNVRGTRNYSIRDYFLRDFYDDHVRTYKRHPIYWLFSSPNGSFNALIYMHRYRPDTASVVLNGYLREYQSKLKSHKQNLEAISIGGGSQTEKTRALKEIERINKVLHELEEYEREVLYPLATEQVDIDLDDGVKQNYPKLGKALKQVRGL